MNYDGSEPPQKNRIFVLLWPDDRDTQTNKLQTTGPIGQKSEVIVSYCMTMNSSAAVLDALGVQVQ